ncbi:MAG TPA: DUF2924 domain-containing protein [Roseiarcus sp.]|nr:DUF2924 domain-containing protein [Roseiarcus sp.]
MAPRGGIKIAQVIELLQRRDGATIAELVAATGWLPHTTRAALTGLRKRGYAVGMDRADKAQGSVYRIDLRRGVKSAQSRESTRLRISRSAPRASGPIGRRSSEASNSSRRRRAVGPVRPIVASSGHLGGIAPTHLPGWLFTRVLAYRIQAAAFGDLDRAILRRLREPRDEALESGDALPFATRGPTTREGVGLKSGALLVREWDGRRAWVTIRDNGYAWNGGVYLSLSQVAKAISGMNWNGHRFFGLKRTTCGAASRQRNAATSPCRWIGIGQPPVLATLEGGSKTRQTASQEAPRLGHNEVPGRAQANQEVGR